MAGWQGTELRDERADERAESAWAQSRLSEVITRMLGSLRVLGE